MRISTLPRPYTLSFPATGQCFALTSDEAQRLLDAEPPTGILSASAFLVQLDGYNEDEPTIANLRPATWAPGPAFIIER